MLEKIFHNKNLTLVVSLIIIYIIGTNIHYLPAYSDFPGDINEIQNCKNGKIVKKAISNSNSNQNDPLSIGNFHHIKKFNSDGSLINSWGVKGTNKGEFLHPHGIGSDSYGNIYVSDAVLCDIQKFDNNGNFLLKFGKMGTDPGEFIQPESIAIDKKDNVYVVDYGTSHGQKFDSNGNFITMWGSLGCKVDQFLIPHDITIDPNGNIYISDSGNVHFRSNYECN